MPNWDAVLKEITKTPAFNGEGPIDRVRRKYLAELSQFTGRNVIAYYSSFLKAVMDRSQVSGTSQQNYSESDEVQSDDGLG